MKLEKCVFCDHVWEATEYTLYHIMLKHLEKVPIGIRNQLLVWYAYKEDEVALQ